MLCISLPLEAAAALCLSGYLNLNGRKATDGWWMTALSLPFLQRHSRTPQVSKDRICVPVLDPRDSGGSSVLCPSPEHRALVFCWVRPVFWGLWRPLRGSCSWHARVGRAEDSPVNHQCRLRCCSTPEKKPTCWDKRSCRKELRLSGKRTVGPLQTSWMRLKYRNKLLWRWRAQVTSSSWTLHIITLLDFETKIKWETTDL